MAQSRVLDWVVATDEESMIAVHTQALLGATGMRGHRDPLSDA